MKPISAALDGSALEAALQEMAQARRAREAASGALSQDARTEPQAPVPEPSGEPKPQARARALPAEPKPKAKGSRARCGPGGSARSAVPSLAEVQEERLRDEARVLERSMRRAGYTAEEAAKAADALLAQIPKPAKWLFIMMSAAQNRAVIRFLAQNTRRPLVAHDLWAHLLEVIRMDTGEVMKDREELALAVGCSVSDVSRIMAQLARINAVRVERRGRGVRYFLNSNVATHLSGDELRARSQEGDGPVLTPLQGGKVA